MKKFFKVVLITLLLILLMIGGLSTWVYFNQNKLTDHALRAANKAFLGELFIDKVTVAPFVNFPYISIDLQNVRYLDNKEQIGQPIYQISDIYVGFDVYDLINGRYNIKKITIDGGEVHMVRFENGDNNLLLSKNLNANKESIDEEPTGDFNFDLQSFSVRNLLFVYDDYFNKKEYDFTIDRIDGKLKTSEDHIFVDIESAFVFDYIDEGQLTFFNSKSVALIWTLDYSPLENIVELQKGEFKLGDASFMLYGCADLGEQVYLDFRIEGDKPDFSLLNAFAPPEVESILNQYQNAGNVFFDGTIRGEVAENKLPYLNVNFGCENVFILNKSINRKIDDLQFYGNFTNGADRNLTTSELRLSNFHARPEQGIFQGNVFIRDFTDPFVNVDLHADLDLEFLGSFFQIEGLRQLKGNILLDMQLDELLDIDFGEQSLARLKQGIDSELTIRDLQFKIPDYPHVINQVNGHADMEDGRIRLDSLIFFIDDQAFRFEGTLSDFPALFHRYDENIAFEFKVDADRIDLERLLPHVDTSSSHWIRESIDNLSLTMEFDGVASDLYDFEDLPPGRFRIEDFHAKLKHFPHNFHDFHAEVLIRDNDLIIDHFRGEIDQSDFNFTGEIINYKKWFQDKPTGDSRFLLNLSSKYLRFNDLLTYNGENYLPEDYRNETLKQFKANLEIDLHYQDSFESADLNIRHLSGKMNIHPLKIQKMSGGIHIDKSFVKCNDLFLKMGESDILINITYALSSDIDTKNRPNTFSLKSKVLDLDALMNYEGPTQEVKHDEALNYFELPFPNIDMTASVGRMNYHKYWLENVSANVRIRDNHFLYLDTLDFDVASGHLAMKGYFNGESPEKIYFNSLMHMNQLDIDKLMVKFDNFGQDELINENIHCKINGTIESTFRMHPDLTPIIEESEAHMELLITEGSLVNFTPMLAMADYFNDKNLNLVRFDTLQNVLDLKDGNLSIPSMNINSSLGFMEISGRQGMDMSMDYFVRVPLKMATKVGWRAAFKSKNRNEIDPDQIDDIIKRDTTKRVRFLNLKISGTTEDFKISLGKDKSDR